MTSFTADAQPAPSPESARSSAPFFPSATPADRLEGSASLAQSATPPAAQLTPLMKQYTELKATIPDGLLFFRMGDFYELFGEDAVEAARLLELTLTTRDRGKPNATPMAGMPHHSAQSYIQRLLKAGKKVAIGEQMEDPATVPNGKIVKREITRIFTPAVQFETGGTEPQWLALSIPHTGRGNKWTLALLDASTGESRVGELGSLGELCEQLSSLSIKHLLRWGEFPRNVDAKPFLEVVDALKNSSVLVEQIPSNTLTPALAERILKAQYGVESLEAFLQSPEARLALGVLVHYVLKTQRLERLQHLAPPAPLLVSNTTLVLGPQTAHHLDLLPKLDGSPSLLQWMDRTKTAAGGRRLRQWLLNPLRQVGDIQARQHFLKFLLSRPPSERSQLQNALGQIYDLERILGRVATRLAHPRDLLGLGRSLDQVARLSELLTHWVQSQTGQGDRQALARVHAPSEQSLTPAAEAPATAAENVAAAPNPEALLQDDPKTGLLRSLESALAQGMSTVTALTQKLLKCLREDAPLVSRDGGIFNPGTSAELDRLLTLTTQGETWLIEFEAKQRQETNINSLKVKYNRVFGYYIEVTSAHLDKVPSHYQRKQTMVGAERFFTDELKKFEEESVHAVAKQKSLEQALFEDLLTEVTGCIPAILSIAHATSQVDALQSLSLLAGERGWTFPTLDQTQDLDILNGVHPLVAGAQADTYVPNSVTMKESSQSLILITGPNMGGKSTVMRQVALTVILGQMGAPVPAERAHWGVVHSLYTRIGAQDAIARGQSTFMVEMSELAHILQNANKHSLLILDEIGRGTSTYDGMSVAWATLEWISQRIGARTLFATHYHELTALEDKIAGLRNAHMAVEVSERGSLRFLYELRQGPASESFGIHVAKIAGLPAPLIKRAWGVLEELEAAAPQLHSGSQLSLFAPPRRSGDPEQELGLTASATGDSSPTVESLPHDGPHFPEAKNPLPTAASPRDLLARDLLEDLEGQSPAEMTPLQSLLWLDRWKQKITG